MCCFSQLLVRTMSIHYKRGREESWTPPPKLQTASLQKFFEVFSRARCGGRREFPSGERVGGGGRRGGDAEIHPPSLLSRAKGKEEKKYSSIWEKRRRMKRVFAFRCHRQMLLLLLREEQCCLHPLSLYREKEEGKKTSWEKKRVLDSSLKRFFSMWPLFLFNSAVSLSSSSFCVGGVAYLHKNCVEEREFFKDVPYLVY